MNYILFDPPEIERFYPITLTRPLGELRVFGGTIRELWEQYLGCSVSYMTRDHLSDLYPIKIEEENIFLHPFGIFNLPDYCGFSYHSDNQKIDKDISSLINRHMIYCEGLKDKSQVSGLDSFPMNLSDFLLNFISLTFSSKSNKMNQFIAPDNGSSVKVLDCTNSHFFNDDNGPILIEEDVSIMEGAMIRGPVHICNGATIKMGAKIYGPTIIGPHCKVGGEVSHSIFLGFSNKAHHGFLGHSIIGEWCNIGAGTSNSNLKNDYTNVKMWDYIEKKFLNTKSQFLGLYMGDHSKCAINTSFNTGTTIGVNCNIFGPGFPRNFIPSFSWGGSQGIKEYGFKKAVFVAETVMNRRGFEINQEYINMLSSVRNITLKYK